MKNYMRMLIMAVALVVALTACDNGNGSGGSNDDPKCNCPNGTVHTDALCSCDGTDCNCIYQPATPDPECTCPNGTVHTGAPCACEAEEYDCNCTYAYTETINLDATSLGGGVFTATVKGTLTATQWEGLATRIENIIQKNISLMTTVGQASRFDGVFTGGNVVMVVEKDATNQVSVSSKYLVSFDFDYLAGQSDEALATSFFDITTEMLKAPLP